MREIIIQLLVAGGVMGVLDYIWLTTMAPTFYKKFLADIMLDKPNMSAALAFYVIYVIGVVAFVLTPALEKNSWQHAVGYGALFGLVAYATYDLTNMATIKGFALKLVMVDMLWGTLLTATVAGVSFWIIKHWIGG